MEIILTKDVERLGKTGQIMRVADGYARNFLIPRRLADLVTPATRVWVQRQHAQQTALEAKELRQVEAVAQRLKQISVTLTQQVGEEGKLFGSVTTADIADALAAQGVTLEKRQIQLEEPIRKLGVYTVGIQLAHGVNASVQVWVVKR